MYGEFLFEKLTLSFFMQTVK